jgi:hypothetical protein
MESRQSLLISWHIGGDIDSISSSRRDVSVSHKLMILILIFTKDCHTFHTHVISNMNLRVCVESVDGGGRRVLCWRCRIPFEARILVRVSVKVKGKVVPVLFFSTEQHTRKAYWGCGGIASRILDLGTRWWAISFTPRPLYHQWKSLWYPLDRRLGGPQSRSGRGGEEKNSQLSIKYILRRACLYRLHCFYFWKYEEELKSNLNIAINSHNHVVDGCTTDMLCPPPAWGTSARRPVGLMGNMTSANSQDGRPLGSMHERGVSSV